VTRILVRLLGACSVCPVVTIATLSCLMLCVVAEASSPAGTSSSTNARRTKTSANHGPAAKGALAATCTPCGGSAPSVRGGGRSKGKHLAKSLPCHPAGYVDPTVRKDVNLAVRDMKRAGITPKITSAWRSSTDQEQMYKCSYNQRCRNVHPGLYRALPPGQSAHEAGFALDISGIATGPRGGKRITPKGRRIVGIMNKHGFKWKYGLRDPVHFEADPKAHGYRDLKQAIHVTQTRCEARIAAAKAASAKPRATNASRTARNRVG
jgi:hypothetical protein